MERVRKSLKGRSWRKVITYFLVCCMFLNTSLPVVLATPTPVGGGFTVGTGTITQDGNATNVVVDQLRSVIEWSSLDTVSEAPNRESLNFSQGSLTNSAVLNRISGDITHFGGDLNAPGMRIFMVNPAGIMFESGSIVNVTQLVASGLGMTNDAFQAVLDDPVNNKMEFLDGDGEVISRAKITANSVYLIGQKVWNISSISAKDGLVVMAAGDEVRLFQDGSDVSVVVNTEGDGFDYPDIRNSGNVDVLNGKIVLAAGDTFSRAIYLSSYLTAQGGTVEVQAALVKSKGRIDVSAYPANADGDGGSISLTGVDEVIISPSIFDDTGRLAADAGLNGKGGDITIQTEGKLTIEENTLITATGGSVSGDGGSVTITCDDFEIAGEIDASFGDELSEPGKLEINSPSAIIADGPNPADLDPLDLPDEDTIYEEDIEALSQAGMDLVVNAEEGITVKDIDDNEITGQFGSIELHATGENSAVTFADVTDTIRTTLGDIIIEAGSGGITAGNLITGKDLASEKPAVGQIKLTTTNGGDIETGDLLIEDGWGHAEINVKASGNLTVNGDVKVGSESAILNVPPQASAEAMIYLKAGDNIVLEGEVYANAHGIEDAADTTKAYIGILAGGDAEINGNLYAEAKSSNNGTADAIIKVEAVGEVVFAEGIEAHAIADQTEVQGTVSDEEPEDYDPEGEPVDHAQIIINDNAIPPVIGIVDVYSTPKSDVLPLDVLANDTQGGGPLEGGTID